MAANMTWHRLCDLSEFPEPAIKLFRINGLDLLLVRAKESYVVIPPSCPHMSAALTEGFFDGCVLTCSKHLWQWSIDDGGTPIGAAEAPLLRYETKEEQGVAFVNLERELLYDHQRENAGGA